MWISVIGDDVLTCEREEHNENDKNAVAIIWVDCVSKKKGHVPLNWSKVAAVYCGAGLGLEIPVNFFLWRCKSYSFMLK